MTIYKVEQNNEQSLDRLINTTTGTSVTIKRLGAEVIGYNVFDPTSNKLLPYLWNNDNDTLPFEGAWKNHATILFPIVGGLQNNESTLLGKDKISSKSNHGFARHTFFNVISSSENESAQIIYEINASEETKKYYPFNFKLQLIYTLEENDLSLKFNITNTDSKDIYFQFGWHPGFSTELGLGGKRADWDVIFTKGDALHYGVQDNGDSALTGNNKIVEFDGPLKYTDTEMYNTLMFGIDNENTRKCKLYNSKLKKGVEIYFADFPQIGLWANENQEYICVEPWQGLDDHEVQETFEDKIGMLKLAPNMVVEKMAIIRPLLD